MSMAGPSSDNLLWEGWWVVEAGDDQSICVGDTVQLQATGANDYTWTPSAGLSCSSCPNPRAFPSVTTTYFVMGDDGTSDSVTISILSPPEIISINKGDPTDCNLPNGSISIEALGSGSLEYSINGGNSWQSDPNFTTLPSDIYSVRVRYASGFCEVEWPFITLLTPVTPQILNVATSNPTLCDVSNGAIIISASGGISPLQYSIDGGVFWQNSNTFQLLTSGIYEVRVRNADGSCEILGGTVNLSGSPDEPDITQISSSPPSDCETFNGEINISVASSPSNFEYSIDGGDNFQTDGSFENLPEGLYEIVVRRTDGSCSKNGGFVDLTSVFRPAFGGASIIQPSDCASPNGNITILASGQKSFGIQH